jgi:hypothetical protein
MPMVYTVSDRDTRLLSRLRLYDPSPQFAGSIPDEVIVIFNFILPDALYF